MNSQAYAGVGISCPVVIRIYPAAIAQKLILQFEYVVSVVVSHVIAVELSNPIFNSVRSILIPKLFVVFSFEDE